MKPTFTYSVLIFVLFLSGQIFGQKDIPNFYEIIEKKFADVIAQNSQGKSEKISKFDFQKICPTKTSFAAQKVFEEYGAIFAAGNGVALPAKCIFATEAEVTDFQKNMKIQIELVGDYYVILQTPAMQSLTNARKQAEQSGLSITPRARDNSRRSYLDTWSLWNSRLVPALNYWKSKQKISDLKFDEIRNSTIIDQITEVLKLEKEENIFFGPGFSSSILYSVAPPGSSQHISLLAFDINEYADARVRRILADNGWHQTIFSDYPHFTYLGVKENELNSLGLREVRYGTYSFWMPNLSSNIRKNENPVGNENIKESSE
ncbi:MAG: hypothetical protein ACR2F2_04810 [Pyrinomonadaceae bacterium]